MFKRRMQRIDRFLRRGTKFAYLKQLVEIVGTRSDAAISSRRDEHLRHKPWAMSCASCALVSEADAERGQQRMSIFAALATTACARQVADERNWIVSASAVGLRDGNPTNTNVYSSSSHREKILCCCIFAKQ